MPTNEPKSDDAAAPGHVASTERLGVVPERACTCHPDDKPPQPCAKRYALAECKAAARYPLDIVNAGEDTYILMSKGHHDPHEFMRAVRADGYTWPLGMPEHRWVRAVPTKEKYRRCIYVFTDPHARGAFPATYAHEAYGDDRYEALAPNVK